jgi:hypothetical protein
MKSKPKKKERKNSNNNNNNNNSSEEEESGQSDDSNVSGDESMEEKKEKNKQERDSENQSDDESESSKNDASALVGGWASVMSQIADKEQLSDEEGEKKPPKLDLQTSWKDLGIDMKNVKIEISVFHDIVIQSKGETPASLEYAIKTAHFRCPSEEELLSVPRFMAVAGEASIDWNVEFSFYVYLCLLLLLLLLLVLLLLLYLP